MAKSNVPADAYVGRSVDWRDSVYLPLPRAAEIAGVSKASLYNYESAGRIKFKRLAGRTLITTESFVAFLESAEDWTPSDRGSHGRAARIQRARAAWAE